MSQLVLNRDTLIPIGAVFAVGGTIVWAAFSFGIMSTRMENMDSRVAEISADVKDVRAEQKTMAADQKAMNARLDLIIDYLNLPGGISYAQ